MGATRHNLSTLCLYLLAVLLTIVQAYDLPGETQHRPPSLETFASYEDMQRYFANRNHRSLRRLENPTDDSYIGAYNQHNEEPASNRRPKRSGAASSEHRALPTEPKLLRFEIADAVEPSEEVKALIRQHRSRETKTAKAEHEEPQQAPKSKAKSSRGGRVKRSAQRQPGADFQVQMIPFEVSDAREPDAQTRDLIKRMRALDLENFKRQPATTARPAAMTTTRPLPAIRTNKSGGRLRVKTLRKRVRRSAPQMIKFELEDAKEPDASMQSLLQQSKASSRESKELKEAPTTLLTGEQGANATRRDSTTGSGTDQQSHESKRMYIYKEAPPHAKAKKSLNSLPHEVQKIISHLMKENSGAKAYVKYIPSQQFHTHAQLKALYGAKLVQPVYGAKLYPAASSYGKYAAATPPPKPEPLQVHVHAVPVVEKVRYVYAPVTTHEHIQYVPQQQHQQQHYVVLPAPQKTAPHHAAPTLSAQPIVVQEPQRVERQPAEVHHTYSADLSHIHNAEPAQAIKDVPAPQFRPSKPDPTYAEAKQEEESAASLKAHNSLELPVEHYKYEEEYQAPEAAEAHDPAPVIKIEYHSPPDPLKDNYKELQEFKELSALMGKSPEDQIHGLTYLLAKEMQSKLQQHRRHKLLDLEAVEQRPQDSTAPILFHPEQPPPTPEPQHAQLSSVDLGKLSAQRGTLIGMGKSKLYVPIVETPAKSADQQHSSPIVKEPPPPKSEPKATESHSFIEYGHLSPNYDMARPKAAPQKKVIVEQVIHHPTTTGHHGSSLVYGHKTSAEHSGEYLKVASGEDSHQHHGIDFGDTDALQYASKYTFGYRIRDFHTGNDFGHKQDRDLNGVTRGQYHILLPDGRVQNVIYHADDSGFHADVSFETSH